MCVINSIIEEAMILHSLSSFCRPSVFPCVNITFSPWRQLSVSVINDCTRSLCVYISHYLVSNCSLKSFLMISLPEQNKGNYILTCANCENTIHSAQRPTPAQHTGIFLFFFLSMKGHRSFGSRWLLTEYTNLMHNLGLNKEPSKRD